MIVEFLSVIAILSATKSLEDNATKEIPSQTLIFPGQELVFGQESYESGKLTYAYCERIDENGERKCKLVREKRPYSDDTYTCNITVKLDHRQGDGEAVLDRLSVMPFGENKAILYQAESGRDANVKINTINLDDCNVTDTAVSITNLLRNPYYAVIVTTYEDSYDIIYKNKYMCGTRGRCKISIGADGKIIEGPANTTQFPVIVSFFPNVIAVDSKSRDKGTFYMELGPGSFMKYDVVIHKPDGSKKSLGKHNVHSPIFKSASNNFLSTCYKENFTTYNCIQYDSDGKKKFEMDPLSRYNKTEITFIYNLPNGGLLALAGICKSRYCALNNLEFLIIKIDSTGKIVGTLNMGALKFDSFNLTTKLAASFHMDEDNNYCLSLAKYQSTNIKANTPASIEASTHCFADQDFS